VAYGGRTTPAVIQGSKQGLIFTLARDTGAPVIPVDERPVPQGSAPGEALSPTQPFPRAPQPLAPSAIRPEEAYGLGPIGRDACRKLIAGARFEGMYTPPSTQGTLVYPFTGGGVNWGGLAFDAGRQVAYVNTSSALHLVTLIPADKVAAARRREPNAEISPQKGAPYGMRRQVLEDASPLGLELLPAHRALGVDAPRVQVGAPEGEDVPEEAFLDELARVQRGRVEAVLQRHLPDPAVVAERRLDPGGLFQRHHEGLVAVDVLAGGDGGQELLGVLAVGRADVDDLDVVPLDQLAPVIGAELEAAFLGRLLRQVFIELRDAHQLDIHRHGIVIQGHGAVVIRVHFAHKAEADDADAKCVHINLPTEHNCSVYLFQVIPPVALYE
jgi:hypothetical protein